ncbi:MAG: ribulose-phosphate 3-epimerase [Sphingobacteriaceae bacterium]|nr:MAG: ribulose-phosphate 3-epimerase [Sphingobacteriaceae bacterium]
MNHLIAPSVLAADFANLQRDIDMLNQSEADWIHFDVMDGVFVPNISFGFPLLKAVKSLSKKPIDVHLMIVNPDNYIDQFASAGASNITVHFEACTHLNKTIQLIKNAGCTAGVALNPHTPVSFLEDIILDLDLVLIMSVNPGFGGQTFIPNTYKKLYDLKALSHQRKPDLKIEVDGGVNSGNCKALFEAGANVLVAGSSVFASADPEQEISQLKHP